MVPPLAKVQGARRIAEHDLRGYLLRPCCCCHLCISTESSQGRVDEPQSGDEAGVDLLLRRETGELVLELGEPRLHERPRVGARRGAALGDAALEEERRL